MQSRRLTLTGVAATAILAAVGIVSGGPGAEARAKPRRFPTPETTGVPAHWKPQRTLTTDLHVTRPGAIVHDVLLKNADLIVDAPDVTIRRVDLQGGRIANDIGPRCEGPMTIEDTTIEPPPGERYSVESEGTIASAAYTARRVKIWRRSEGFRVSGNGYPDCAPVRIVDSFAKIVIPPGRCDLHSDGIQGYGAPHTSISNMTIDFREANCGTAPFFFPSAQDNTSVSIRRLLVMGGGYAFRLGVPGTVADLKIVDHSWVFDPIDVACSRVTAWDAQIVTITADYQVKRIVRTQRCDTEGGE